MSTPNQQQTPDQSASNQQNQQPTNEVTQNQAQGQGQAPAAPAPTPTEQQNVTQATEAQPTTAPAPAETQPSLATNPAAFAGAPAAPVAPPAAPAAPAPTEAQDPTVVPLPATPLPSVPAVPGQQTFRVFVKTLTGRTIDLQVPYTNEDELTVQRIKETLEAKESIPVNQQTLIFGGKTLQNDSSLREYGITEGKTLHMVLNLRGGAQ